MARERRCHYVLSSHWDREWYQTFQEYRYRLVRMIDHLLEGYREKQLLGPFQTDGQSIILEDYLEVRTEREAEVRARAKEGKFRIGPWYVLPDEFLASGESLIRNLYYGRAYARWLGVEPSNAGFACDLFGHNSQLPQIFKGFGIRGGFIWRGTNLPQHRNLVWTGADGTRLPCYRFGRVGYGDYAFDVRRLNRPDLPFDADQVAKDLESFIEKEAKKSDVGPILLFDGCDHQEWEPQAYAVLVSKMKERGGEFPIVHTSLDDYLDDMLPEVDKIRIELKGELREAGRSKPGEDEQWVIPGVASSRVWIKQWNAACQTLLCHWAEPVSSFSHWVLGMEFPQDFLDVAWKWLLKNHPHDSICGCSIDQVHEDMKVPLQPVRTDRESTDVRVHSSAGCQRGRRRGRQRGAGGRVQSAAATDQRNHGDGDQIPRTGRCLTSSSASSPNPPSPSGAQAARKSRTSALPSKWIACISGTPLPFHRRVSDTRCERESSARNPGHGLHDPDSQARRTRAPDAALEHHGDRQKPPRDRERSAPRDGRGQWHPVNHGQAKRADVQRPLDVRRLRRHCDGWYHGLAVNDQVFSSAGAKAEIAVVDNGPMVGSLRIRTTMSVPSRFDFPTMRRADTFADLVIDSVISLRPGADRVEVETTIQNVADDHRVRVLFPTKAESATFYTDTPFDVVRRDVALRIDNHLYRELEVETRPQQSFTAINDKVRGLRWSARG